MKILACGTFVADDEVQGSRERLRGEDQHVPARRSSCALRDGAGASEGENGAPEIGRRIGRIVAVGRGGRAAAGAADDERALSAER